MKIYEVDFNPMWPVPYGLIIAANNKEEAKKIAEETVKHTEVEEITEIKIDKPKVIFYESGNY
jgi:hypothetical protein